MGSEGRGVGRAIALGAVATLWVTTCVGGLAALAWYQATPGTAAPAADWPAHSRVARAAGADTLVLFVHPKCPCSRATIENLAVLMAHCPPGHLRAVVLLVRPAGMPAGWERTDLWTAAEAIPGVTVATDVAGAEAARFGAQTSGQAMLFDPAGRLRFRGGLTPGRGHAGDSAGAAAVLAIVDGEPSGWGSTPVFGCPLGGDSCPVLKDAGGPQPSVGG